jgi:nitronate monooxygenase
MTLRTAFTELFSLDHPVALAPMGGISGGALAAAVSNGGGLGLVGGGLGDPLWLDRELAIAAERTDRPWGVGFLNWGADVAAVERALAYHPRAVMLSFGDPAPFLPPVRDAGVALIMQVTDLEEASQARDAGADVIVAQGTEAGGHGGHRSTLPFVPAVADLVAPTPVLAAGGIADGRGIAAALALGAAGALLGTRFLATPEVLADPSVPKAVVAGSGEDTERSRITDIARGSAWPSRYPARTLRDPFYDRWRGHEDELAEGSAARRDCQRSYQEAVARGELPASPVWAGEAIDLITEVTPAADLVGLLTAQAERALARAARLILPGPADDVSQDRR